MSASGIVIAGHNKKPRHVVILDELPRKSLGKVLKTELRQRVPAAQSVT